MITRDPRSTRKDGYVSVSGNTYTVWLMTVLSLKTELDVARLLWSEGWLPEDINGILVFPLPRAAFRHLGIKSGVSTDSDVINATRVTPTTLYRARQLLVAAGWLDRELDSLLKPCTYSFDPWATQTIHDPAVDNYLGITDPRDDFSCEISSNSNSARPVHPLNQQSHYLQCSQQELTPLSHYRLKMALKRVTSLVSIIILVTIAVFIVG